MKPGYKQTEVGVIPEDWNVKSLRDFATIKTGPFGTILKASEYSNDSTGVPLISVGEVREGFFRITDETPRVSENVTRRLPQYVLKKGDIVFGRKGGVDRSALIRDEQDGWFLGSDGLAVRTFKTCDAEFLSLQFQSARVKSWLVQNAIGTTMPSLNQAILSDVAISLAPSIEEQEVVAQALNDADALIESLAQLIVKKRDIKQGAMQELLTSKRRLPGFNDAWKTKPLKRLLQIPVTDGPHLTPQFLDDGVPFLSVNNLVDGRIDMTSLRFISKKDHAEFSKKCKPQKGDLLLGKAASVGKVAMVDTDVEFNIWSPIALIRINAENHARFIYFALQSRAVARQIELLTNSSSQGNIGMGDIEQLMIQLPSIDEQYAIAAILSEMDTEIAALEARLIKARQLKQGMMQELLTGRIRLVPRSSKVVSLPVKQVDAKSSGGEHNSQINEAVVLSILTHRFGSEQFPLGRFRRTKLTYLLHRHVEYEAQGFLKKAAGPYNPQIKYGGAEKIAIKNGYVRQHKSGQFEGFVAADNIDKAHAYFDKWYGADVLKWLDNFKFKKKDELELLTTVDMAMHDLVKQGQEVSLESVKMVIKAHPEWTPKLDRAIFSDDNIVRAMAECRTLFVD